tara:strand:+ start:1216 stop:4329 length:3114 start_codon:yes stop_codon:yes gene_type:complete
MPKLKKKRKFSRIRKYQNGGKDISFISRFLDAQDPKGRHLRNLDRVGVSVEDIKKFYETGVISDDISDREIQGGKNLSPEDIRAGLKYHLDNMDDRRDSSGNLDRVDSQVTYDYFSGLLKLSDEELPRSYRRVFGLPAQFYDFPDMDEIKPIGVTSISTDVSDKELQMSEEQGMQDPNYLPPGAWREPHYSYNSMGIPTQDGWMIHELGPLDKYGRRKERHYIKYFKKKDGSYTRPRSIYYQGEEYQAGGKIKIKKKTKFSRVKKYHDGGGVPHTHNTSTGEAQYITQPIEGFSLYREDGELTTTPQTSFYTQTDETGYYPGIPIDLSGGTAITFADDSLYTRLQQQRAKQLASEGFTEEQIFDDPSSGVYIGRPGDKSIVDKIDSIEGAIERTDAGILGDYVRIPEEERDAFEQGITDAINEFGEVQAAATLGIPLDVSMYPQRYLVNPVIGLATGNKPDLSPLAMTSELLGEREEDAGFLLPSEGLEIENPIGAFAVDVLADPLVIFGLGKAAVTRGPSLIRQLGTKVTTRTMAKKGPEKTLNMLTKLMDDGIIPDDPRVRPVFGDIYRWINDTMQKQPELIKNIVTSDYYTKLLNNPAYAKWAEKLPGLLGQRAVAHNGAISIEKEAVRIMKELTSKEGRRRMRNLISRTRKEQGLPPLTDFQLKQLVNEKLLNVKGSLRMNINRVNEDLFSKGFIPGSFEYNPSARLSAGFDANVGETTISILSYFTQNKKIPKDLLAKYTDDEIRQLKELADFRKIPSLRKTPRSADEEIINSAFSFAHPKEVTGSIVLGPGFTHQKGNISVIRHEVKGHAVQGANIMGKENLTALDVDIINLAQNVFGKSGQKAGPGIPRQTGEQMFNYLVKSTSDPDRAYFRGTEGLAFLQETVGSLLEKGYIRTAHQEITSEILEKAFQKGDVFLEAKPSLSEVINMKVPERVTQFGARLIQMAEGLTAAERGNYFSKLSGLLNQLPATLPILGGGAYLTIEGDKVFYERPIDSDLQEPLYRSGGKIKINKKRKAGMTIKKLDKYKLYL